MQAEPQAAQGTQAARTKPIGAIVLAAGKSTRMRSKTPKALHPVCGWPLLAHILHALFEAGVARPTVVVGHQAEAIQTAMDARFGAGAIGYAAQSEPRGTGHAAQMAETALAGFDGTLLVVPGDTPLLTGELLAELVAVHRAENNAATLLTAVLGEDAGAYGRIVRDAEHKVVGIVEARDATDAQKQIREISTSVYAFRAPDLFRALGDLRPDNAQGELYLTDVIGLLRRSGAPLGALVSPDPDIVLGVNTRVELAEVDAVMRAHILRRLMLGGVSVLDPAATYVEAGVRIGQDTTLLPGTMLRGATMVGENCVIGPQACLTDARIGDGVHARACFIEDSEVGADCRIGPFANLRPGTVLHAGVKIGDFVETKNAILHENVSVGHLAYLGDAEIGARTNIGAGTITCNYDGVRKHRTAVGADAFIGSHTTLVAPVVVEHAAFTAAGSVITDDVPSGALAIGRERQTNKEGWAARRRGARAGETTPRTPSSGEETQQP